MPYILNITDFEGRDQADRITGSTSVSSDNNTANVILDQSDLIEEWIEENLKSPSTRSC